MAWSKAVVCALIVLSFPYSNRAIAQDPLTGGAFIEGSRSALNDVIEKAKEAGQQLLVEAAIHAQGLVSRIEKIAGENISKPISSLDQNLQNEIAATRQTVEAVRTTAASLPRCIGDEAQTALASLKGGLQTALNTLPAVQGEPVAYMVQAAASRAPYAVVRKPKSDVLLMMSGANLWAAEQKCSVTANAEPVSGKGKPVALRVVSSDIEKVMLAMPAAIANGEWLVKVTVEVRRPIIGCLLPAEEEISAAMDVRSPVELNYTASVTPACKGYEPCKKAIEGSCTNGSSRRDKNCQGSYTFDDPKCEVTGVAADWHSGGRCSNGGTWRVINNALIVNATADKTRSGTCKRVWGGTMVGRKRAPPEVQPALVMNLKTPLIPGSSEPFEVQLQKPASCELESWTLGGNAISTENVRIALADRTVIEGGTVSTSASGLLSTFNSVTRRGTVQLAGSGCL